MMIFLRIPVGPHRPAPGLILAPEKAVKGNVATNNAAPKTEEPIPAQETTPIPVTTIRFELSITQLAPHQL